jgi:hypothetical protein
MSYPFPAHSPTRSDEMKALADACMCPRAIICIRFSALCTHSSWRCSRLAVSFAFTLALHSDLLASNVEE